MRGVGAPAASGGSGEGARARGGEAGGLVRPFVVGCSLFVLLYHPLFTALHSFGIVDHDYFNAWQLAVNDHLRRGALLHWMFWLCGGQPGLGNPQSGALSPFNVIGLFASPVVQLKLELALNAALGLWGFLALARSMGGSPSAGLVGFVIWSGNGLSMSRVLHGQATYWPLWLVPCLLALLTAEAQEARAFAPSAKRFAWLVVIELLVLYQDGFHVLIYTAPLLAVLALGWSLARRAGSPLVLLVGSLAVAVMLALPRLLPTVAFLAATPRIVEHGESLSVLELVTRLWDGDSLGYYAAVRAGQLESYRLGFLAYVGVVPLLLCASWPALSKPGKLPRWPWYVALVGGAALALGDAGPLSPWRYVSQLPVLHSVRAPFKFLAGSLAAVACCATFASAALEERLRARFANERVARFAPLTLAVLLVLLFGASDWPLLVAAEKPYQPPHESIAWDEPFRQLRANPASSYSAIAHNVDVLNCYEPTSRKSPVRPGAPLAALARGAGTLAVQLEPNTIVVDYQLHEPDTLRIFQSFDPGWQADSDARIERVEDGTMMLPLDPEHRRVRLRYESHGFVLGLSIAAIVLLLWAALALALRRRAHAAQ